MNNTIIWKKRVRLLVGVFFGLLIFLGTFTRANASTANLMRKTIPNTSVMVSEESVLPLRYSADSSKFEIKGTNGYTAAVKQNGNKYCLCIKKTAAIKKANTSSEVKWTANNPMQVKFKKVAIINGKSIDVTINFTQVAVTKHLKKAQEDADWIALAYIKNDYLRISSSFADGYGYRADKNTKIKTTITYSDTGEVVDLPFFQAIRDIDAKSDYSTECWTAGPEYQDTFYKYNTNENTFKDRSIYAWAKSVNTAGDDELLRSGGYISTNDGSFTQEFWDGDCSTGMYLYSQYANNLLEKPTKSVNKTTAKPIEELTYTIKQKVGTMYKTMLEPYGTIKITDTIPTEVNYKDGSARLYDGSGNDITNQANISYNSSTRLLSCTLNDSWRTNQDNYNGQTLRLEFKAKIKPIKERIIIKNTGDVSLENSLNNKTNQVETNVYPKNQNDQTTYIRLKIRIKNDKNELTEAHGKPTFIFKIEANGREYYRSVTFGDSDASKDWKFEKKDGYIMATGKMEDLRENGEDGVLCKVTPISVSRFKVTAENMEVEYTDKDETCFTFPFIAEKTTWQYYSHNDIKVNRVSGK